MDLGQRQHLRMFCKEANPTADLKANILHETFINCSFSSKRKLSYTEAVKTLFACFLILTQGYICIGFRKEGRERVGAEKHPCETETLISCLPCAS